MTGELERAPVLRDGAYDLLGTPFGSWATRGSSKRRACGRTFSAFEVWGDIRDERVVGLEGLLLHIYRDDPEAAAGDRPACDVLAPHGSAGLEIKYRLGGKEPAHSIGQFAEFRQPKLESRQMCARVRYMLRCQSPMPTNVHVIQPSDFLRATPEGHADLAAAERLLYDIAEKARDIEDFNVLIDLRTVSGGLLTAGELWHLAEKFARHRHIGRRKTAILSPRDRFDNARFFALCAAVQENSANVVPFRSYEDAMEWLLGGPSSGG